VTKVQKLNWRVRLSSALEMAAQQPLDGALHPQQYREAAMQSIRMMTVTLMRR